MRRPQRRRRRACSPYSPRHDEDIEVAVRASLRAHRQADIVNKDVIEISSSAPSTSPSTPLPSPRHAPVSSLVQASAWWVDPRLTPCLAWLTYATEQNGGLQRGLWYSAPRQDVFEHGDTPWAAMMRFVEPSTVYLLPDDVERVDERSVRALFREIKRDSFLSQRKTVVVLRKDSHHPDFIRTAEDYRKEVDRRDRVDEIEAEVLEFDGSE